MKKPADIQHLDEEIARFKKSEKRRNLRDEKEDVVYSRTAMGWQISVELLSAVFIGTSLGYVIDLFFKTAPWFLVILTILGGAAGMLNVYRTFKAEEENNKE